MSRVATVQSIYEAFGRGDIPAILEKLSEDVSWDQWPGGSPGADAGLPYLLPRTGRAEVGEFFAALGALEFHSFEPTGFLEGGNQVAAVIRLEVTQKASGRRIEDEEIHLWTFNDDGQIVYFRHFLDTAKHLVGAPVA